MAEYIDRLDASTIPVLPAEQRVPFKTVGEAFEEGWRQALEMVAMMESADVVEVVRCADCKYDERCMFQEFVRDERVEPYDKTVFFCADSKRKDGGQDDA